MASEERRSRKTGKAKGAAFAILGLTGLVGMQQITSHLACLLAVPLEILLDTLPSILLRSWHILQPCAFGHLRLLEGLLRVSVSWKIVLTLTGA